MKKLFFAPLVLSFCASALFANPPGVIEEKGIGVARYYEIMNEIVAEHDSNNVAQILDVDGTLTDHRDPGKAEGVSPRGHMDLVIRKLCQPITSVEEDSENGAKEPLYTIFSSAWPDFGETVERFNKLNLPGFKIQSEETRTSIIKAETSCYDPLLLGEESDVDISEGSDANSIRRYFEVKQNGNLISCRKVENYTACEHLHNTPGVFQSGDIFYSPAKNNDMFYRYKHLTLDHDNLRNDREFKVVVFVDDSSGNCKIFRDYMKHTMWYAHAEKVYILNLSGVIGEVKEEDIVKEFQSVRRLVPTVSNQE